MSDETAVSPSPEPSLGIDDNGIDALHTFDVGGMWEGPEWYIDQDRTVEISSMIRPCKHCHSPRLSQTSIFGGVPYDTSVVTCPWVVIATNDAGYNSTGVCLQCILEAAEQLGVTAK